MATDLPPVSSRYKWTALSGVFVPPNTTAIMNSVRPAQRGQPEATFGYNPMETLLGDSGLRGVPPEKAAEITGKTFFPELISEPFIDGLRIAFTFSLVLFVLAAAASWMRGAMPPGPVDDDVGEALEEAVLA